MIDGAHTSNYARFLVAVLCLATVSGLGCDAVPRANLGDSGGFGAPTAALEGAEAGGADQIARAIEEADIIKIVGDTIYALNRFKGLLIVDVSDPDDPRLMGELDLRGRGIEMYVVGAQAYILLSADYDYAYYGGVGLAEVDGGSAGRPIPPQPDFEGSQLAIVDVSDPSAPVSEGKLNLVGFANESRRVGDVIYVVGSNYTPYYGYREDEERHEGFVASVNVADPRNIVAVERKTVAGNALNMHVSETALFAASQEYNYEDGNTYTNVQVVDISDPAGTIAMRGSVDVPGTIRNRFYMDDYEGVFRIATESQGFGFRRVRLFTYDLADLDNVIALGQTDIIEGETLEAVRFDGPRGYVVTFLQVDPLFVLDLRDPTAPAVAGHLEVPGFSTHIEPRGDRLIAIGIDDTDGRRPAVSYYDVEDPANPAELGRVVLGPPGSFTESEATYDEKAFKIVDELGLIAIPFRYVNYAWSPLPDEPVLLPGGADGAAADQASPDTHDQPACLNGVQLVDFDDGGLAQRGWFEHRGSVERVGVICDRVFALSQVCLQTVNISDRDNPVKAGQADFFNEDEMPYYADDCGDYYGPWDFPQQDPFDTLSILIQVFLNGDLCGMLSMLPLLALPVSLFLMKASLPGRRRSGGRPVNLP